MDAPSDHEIKALEALREYQHSPNHDFFTNTDDYYSGEILPVDELSQSTDMWAPCGTQDETIGSMVD